MYNIASSRVEVYYFLWKFYVTIFDVVRSSFKFLFFIFNYSNTIIFVYNNFIFLVHHYSIFRFFKFREILNSICKTISLRFLHINIPFNIQRSALSQSYDQNFLKNRPQVPKTHHLHPFKFRAFSLRVSAIHGIKDHGETSRFAPNILPVLRLSKRTEPQQKRWNLDGGTVPPEGISWAQGDARTRCTRLYLQVLIHMYPISMHITSE